MSRQPSGPGPRGGLQAHARALRRWRWDSQRRLLSAPLRCRREQWYLARGRLRAPGLARAARLGVRFLQQRQELHEQALELHRPAGLNCGAELLGWIQAPGRATHLQLSLPDPRGAPLFEQVVFHPVADRDPTCHPLANVPRWDTYRPPFPIRRIVLPHSLRSLARLWPQARIRLLEAPAGRGHLAAETRGAACVIDPDWVRRLRLTIADLERLACQSWLMTDLETIARLLQRAGVATRLVAHAAANEIMSARVAYADVPTRGLALQDVVPYATLDARAGFRLRALKASAAWKRYAGRTGFATLLTSETPWQRSCGDVLSAARPVGRGRLLASDLPWLVAGRFGPPLAPRLARHLLRMHLGAPLADHLQYWNRGADEQVLVRDIAALPQRYPPLQSARWAAPRPGLAQLGISLPPLAQPGPERHLLLRSGRIDQRAAHDGVPPEPMIIFMRWLAREAAQRTAWARRALANVRVTWQFESAVGLRYAVDYDSAARRPPPQNQALLRLRTRPGAGGPPAAGPPQTPTELVLARDAGIFGDGSLAFQDELTARLRRVIERLAG